MALKGPPLSPGDVEQDIDMQAGKYENIVRLGDGLVEAVLSAQWEVVNDGKKDKWVVLFDDVKFRCAAQASFLAQALKPPIWAIASSTRISRVRGICPERITPPTTVTV